MSDSLKIEALQEDLRALKDQVSTLQNTCDVQANTIDAMWVWMGHLAEADWQILEAHRAFALGRKDEGAEILEGVAKDSRVLVGTAEEIRSRMERDDDEHG